MVEGAIPKMTSGWARVQRGGSEGYLDADSLDGQQEGIE